jgi:ribonuclease HI
MKLKVYTDGGSRGNPGPAAYAVVITDESGKVVKEYGRYLGRMTNNEAEYNGAISALKEALALGADEVEVFSDSEVMVRQVNGVYRCKAANLQPFLNEVRALKARSSRRPSRTCRGSTPWSRGRFPAQPGAGHHEVPPAEGKTQP